MIDKEVLELWKEISPEDAFSFGLKEYAGQLWIPSHVNIKHALNKIAKLEKKADPVALAFLGSIKEGLTREEPQDAPGVILNTFFAHLVKGATEKQYISLAEQGLHYLAVEEQFTEREWPVELRIFTTQNCQGAIQILNIVKKKTGKETQQALTALQKRLTRWQKTAGITLKKGDFKEIYGLLQKHSKGLGRKHLYAGILKHTFGYLETPEEIEHNAVTWIDEELPEFDELVRKLATRYKCKPRVEDIDKAIEKRFYVAPKELVKTIGHVRTLLQPLAHQEWVKIAKGYNVKVIETPSYLAPLLPTAAMQAFDGLKKPFSIFFATTDTRGSPSTNLPDIVQTIIHEEYGHCVNFHDSYTNDIRVVEKLSSGLDTPITEGISFNRELEALHTFRRMLKETNQIEQKFIGEIEQHTSFAEFVDAYEFTVRQWRMVRFLRAVSDMRINTEKQTFPEFIEWAHKKTGLSKKLIFDQTFHFQETAGYAPCYSMFGQRLKAFQRTTRLSLLDFNTYVASRGFPCRAVFEEEIRKL